MAKAAAKGEQRTACSSNSTFIVDADHVLEQTLLDVLVCLKIFHITLKIGGQVLDIGLFQSTQFPFDYAQRFLGIPICPRRWRMASV
jgi:hypothetical protein